MWLTGHRVLRKFAGPTLYFTVQKSIKKESMYSKISNTFLFLFSNKMMVIRAGIHKLLVRIANKEDLDQKHSDQGLPCLSKPVWQATSVCNFRTFPVAYTQQILSRHC